MRPGKPFLNEPVEDPLPDRRPPRNSVVASLISNALVAVVVFAMISVAGILPPRLDPLATLDPMDEPNFLTAFKLSRAASSPSQCFAVMERVQDIRLTRLRDREVSDQCHIRGQVEVRRLSTARIGPEATTCQTALRLYMWERHSLQPAALRWFGEEVTGISEIGSYNCRRINTTRGPGRIMSAHATASAIDISAVEFADGRELDLLYGWNDEDPRERAFWREIRDGACQWFKTVLSPEFNALHADHFHFGQDRYGACR